MHKKSTFPHALFAIVHTTSLAFVFIDSYTKNTIAKTVVG
jgi:hypothetical protein